MSDPTITYVGVLYAFQCEDSEPERCERSIIGVDSEFGLVQADTRGELMRGQYLKPPKNARGRRCIRLWYERRRVDFPRDRFWFHDLDDARVYVAGVDNRTNNPDRDDQAVPAVVIQGADVETCPDPPGDFLCG